MNHVIDKKSSAPDLTHLFSPRSIAVIGASRRPETVGYAMVDNLLRGGFKGKIHLVNPKADEICGLPCFHSVEAIPESFDLAVVIVPPSASAATLKACGEKGAKAAIVITAGFREIGAEGRKLEDELCAVAQDYGIAMLGPNCLGMINTDPDFLVNASFARTMPVAGNIAFISQSGALCTAVLDYAKGAAIGFSKFVSLGNKSALNEIDMLTYLKHDPKTHVILLYVEDLVDARRFIEASREITGELEKSKPILVIKSGRTAQGAQAAQSHTGSLMGADEVYDAIFAQAGVLRMDSIQQMFDLAIAFSKQPFPTGPNTAIITNAGGPGIMATDTCIRAGLSLAKFKPETEAALSKVLPPTANIHNPIDVIGDARADRYEEALKIVAKDPNVDSILVILTPQAMTAIEETAQVIVKAAKGIKVPIISCFMGIADVSAGVKILEENGIPHYRFPENAGQVLGLMHRYQQWIQRPRTSVKAFKVDSAAVKKIIQETKQSGQEMVPIDRAMAIFEAYGFPVLPYGFARTPQEAANLAEKIGFPAVVKTISPQIVHKFDFGAVRLNLSDAQEVAQACNLMTAKFKQVFPEGKLDGFFVQKMSAKGLEVILGMNRDAALGATLMFGLGGIYVEVLKDVTFRLAPLRERSAELMVEEIRGYRMLKGVRGEKPSDIAKITECIERLSQLACDHPEIQEIDMNPLMVHADGLGASVLDARIILK
ncbi:MAG TPA: acyl-CoA synthetase [Candidatus Omnitrophica bacterium]|nr:acyl-CoA synthetase [Candidatus Omnitrophota bacterium]